MCQSASKYIVVGQAPACGQPASACRTCGLAALGQRLAQQPRPQLGFTDLEEDEALLVWLCRRWYQGMRDRTQIEAELAAKRQDSVTLDRRGSDAGENTEVVTPSFSCGIENAWFGRGFGLGANAQGHHTALGG